MGHAARVDDTPTPPTGVQYLLVRHGRGGAWFVPTCAGFHLGGGSPTSDHVCVHAEKKREEREEVQCKRTQPAHSGSVCFQPVSVPDGWSYRRPPVAVKKMVKQTFPRQFPRYCTDRNGRWRTRADR